MTQSFTGKMRIRKSFGRIPEAIQMPNLIEVQRSSYEQFLQREVRPAQRRDEGLEAVFRSVFPIKDFNERAMLEYVSYEFEDPKYDVEECIQRDMTYAAPLKVKLRLIVFETDEETGAIGATCTTSSVRARRERCETTHRWQSSAYGDPAGHG